MPRPGPRPYQCVRRAWHSDRHQPIRGSLIHEIFRIVNEIHSSATKKNREWQEKLPIVVLKAEEIMYSKANSEAEYVDVNTLWDRANDAINTIIRRDESSETGELLQPCIEAALHLGCTPRRSSRSQRINNPRCYLNPEKPVAVPPPLSNLDNRIQRNSANDCSSILQSSKLSTSSLNCDVSRPKEYVLSSCSIYPLYYGNQFHLREPDAVCFPNSSSHLPNADKKDAKENHSSCGKDASHVHFLDSGFDLSLRLGPLEAPCSGALDNSNVGSKTSYESLHCNYNSFSLPEANAREMLDCSSTKWSDKDQNSNVERCLRKQKAVVSHPSEHRRFCSKLKLPVKQFDGRINNAD